MQRTVEQFRLYFINRDLISIVPPNNSCAFDPSGSCSISRLSTGYNLKNIVRNRD